MHHTYILNVCRNPGISQEALSQLIFVNKSNVARQLAVLEEKGMFVGKRAVWMGGDSLFIQLKSLGDATYPPTIVEAVE